MVPSTSHVLCVSPLIADDYLHTKGHSYTRLDGSTNRVQRFINIKRFNQPDSNIFCFIMTTRAGGLGVNLQVSHSLHARPLICLHRPADTHMLVDD